MGSERQDVIYEGQWMDGYKQGWGTYYYSKDKYYEGNWVRNSKEGRGTFRQPDGQFVGDWKNDKKHGSGRLTLNNGTILDGEWQNDIYRSGTVTYSNGDKYEGEMSDNRRQGYGTYNYANNQTTYKGRWNNNGKTGDCSIRYYNGDLYDGKMNNNVREGYDETNKYRWRNTGDEIEAQFANDEPVKGRIVFADGGEFDFKLRGR